MSKTSKERKTPKRVQALPDLEHAKSALFSIAPLGCQDKRDSVFAQRDQVKFNRSGGISNLRFCGITAS